MKKGAFKIRRPFTSEELRLCINCYSKNNDSSFLPFDFDKSFSELSTASRSGKYVKVADSGGLIVGWMYAAQVSLQHVKQSIIQQMYFSSELSGVPAYRLVVQMHNDLIDYAESKGIQLVVSAGSHMDESNTFVKILEKNGWDRRGYTAVWKTSHYKD